MIWDSPPLMTLLDIVAIVVTVAAMIFLCRPNFVRPEPGNLIILAGLLVMSLFYVADLIVMYFSHVLVPDRTMYEVMASLHLDYYWYISMTALVLIAVGLIRAHTEQSEVKSMLENYGLLINQMNDACLIVIGNRIVETNIAFENLSARTHEEIIDRDISELWSELGYGVRPPKDIQVGMADQGIYVFTDPMEFPDGSSGFCEVRMSPINASSILTGYIVFIHDVTERVNSNKQLLESEKMLRDVMEALPIGVMTRRPDGSSYLNKRISDILGYSEIASEKYEETLQQILYFRDTDEPYPLEQVSGSVLRGDDFRTEDIDAILPDGSRIHLEVSASPVFDSEDTVKAAVATIQDVTEKVKARKEILELNRDLETRVDERTKELKVAREAAEHAQTRAELANRALLKDENRARLLSKVAVAANSSDSLEEVLKTAIDCMCDYTGWPVGHIYIPDTDGSGRLRLVPSSVWHLDSDEQFEAFKSITMETSFGPGFGLPGRVFKSQEAAWIEDVQEDDNFPRAQVADIGVRGAFGFPIILHGEVAAVLEFFSVSREKEGTDELFEFISVVGRQLGLFLERKRSRQVIEYAKRAAEEANQAKSTFLANMSHEIRTPMNAILGFAQIIAREADLDEIQHKNLQTIMASGRHLLDLINGILDMSKIEAGRMETYLTDFNLKELLERLTAMFTETAIAKGVEFTFDDGPNLPSFVHTDEAKMRQILINLLGNAIKFTPHGGQVVLRATAAPQDGEMHLTFEVIDTGPGIDPKHQASLFDPFDQGSTKNDSIEGTGLGLAICREYADMLNGTVGFESELGKGSRFFVDLPVSETKVDPSDELPDDDFSRIVALSLPVEGCKILIVDDDANNRSMMEQFLTKCGFDLRQASDGEKALGLLEEWQPDLVLMDRRMPGMDGLEATRRIRSCDEIGRTAVIIVTASVFEDHHVEAIEAGADGWVRKPYLEGELLHEIGRVLSLELILDGPTIESQPTRTDDKLSGLAERIAQNRLSEFRDLVLKGNMVGFVDCVSKADLDEQDSQSLLDLAAKFEYDRLLEVLT